MTETLFDYKIISKGCDFIKGANYFLAIPVSHKLKKELQDFMETSSEYLTFDRWIHHEDLHITLAFLGSCSNQQVEAVNNACYKLDTVEPFTLTLDKLGTFGRSSDPRIFWAGVLKSEPLSIQRAKVFEAMEKLGFSLDQRPFAPHITLARKWKGNDPFSNAILSSLNIPTNKWNVEEYVLYKTNMNTRPMYEVIERFRILGKGQ
ncbi:RNA 2',3'-cyclic phosphodiesterase [Bacillus solitudinis]|uniref:RNA 2',3'-cyclic phosphodiesterase n=1 Tax=Bacillus solitudinis TaxID=2014074 RepID=UPI000C248568|nr:RNA 2',3'-cyclic phosphodiesterase [Bacillus solitudinis]